MRTKTHTETSITKLTDCLDEDTENQTDKLFRCNQKTEAVKLNFSKTDLLLIGSKSAQNKISTFSFEATSIMCNFSTCVTSFQSGRSWLLLTGIPVRLLPRPQTRRKKTSPLFYSTSIGFLFRIKCQIVLLTFKGSPELMHLHTYAITSRELLPSTTLPSSD